MKPHIEAAITHASANLAQAYARIGKAEADLASAKSGIAAYIAAADIVGHRAEADHISAVIRVLERANLGD